MKDLKELLEEIKQNMEEDAVTIDGEFGSCRNAEQLALDGHMWDYYYKLIKFIESMNVDKENE